MPPRRLPFVAALMITAFCAAHLPPSYAGSLVASSQCDGGACAAPEAVLDGIETRATEVVVRPTASAESAGSLWPRDCRTKVCLDTGSHFFNTRIAANGTRIAGIAAEALRARGRTGRAADRGVSDAY